MYLVPTPQVRNKVVGLGRGGVHFTRWKEGKYLVLKPSPGLLASNHCS